MIVKSRMKACGFKGFQNNLHQDLSFVLTADQKLQSLPWQPDRYLAPPKQSVIPNFDHCNPLGSHPHPSKSKPVVLELMGGGKQLRIGGILKCRS